MLTESEKRLRAYLKVLLIVHLLVLVFCILSLTERQTVDPAAGVVFLVGLAGIAFLNILLNWYAVADLRRFTLLVSIQIWESAALGVAAGTALLHGGTDVEISMWMASPTLSGILLGSLGFDAVNLIVGSLLLSSAQRSRYRLKYFSPLQFKTLMALAEVIIYGESKVISGEDVARNVDSYFYSFEAKTKWTMALVVTGLYFYPLLSLLPPLPYIAAGERHEFLKKKFYRDVEARLIPEWWRVIVQGLIRIAKQMCYIGYYNDRRTFASVGYVPFSERKDYAERLRKSPRDEDPPLCVKSEDDLTDETIDGDVVVIGSGAGASILAKGLVEGGRKVLMVERGNHERPKTYNENEMEMVSRLFQDGAIQAARDFRFTVFQGSCVGGSTVVNNAVCFRIPEPVLDNWIDPKGMNTGLDKARVLKSTDAVWKMIGTENMNEKTVRLNPGGILFEKGCRNLGFDKSPNMLSTVNANISDCLGCGYCNIGCSYNKKLSMLVTVLPEIQQRFGKESLDIVAGCEVIKLQRNGKKISYAVGEFRSGRRIRIRGKTFVVSAGAISSSILLLKSKLGIANAGRNLSFNVGSQMTAAFPYKIDSYDGLQISHYMKAMPDRGFIMESWFNPPMFQSTAMPGWFEDHFRNMRRYDRLACVGVLVGSESNARVRVGGLTRREIDYVPTEKDFKTLLRGLELSGEIMLSAGAESVMPNTFKYYEYRSAAELKSLPEKVKDPSEIALGTGHPQGGNVIGNSAERGAVSPEFKAFGYDNLYVCDASVFPTSLGVNPQLTVMALADYAVPFVKDNRG